MVRIAARDTDGNQHGATGLVLERGPRTLRASAGAGGESHTLAASDVPYVGRPGGPIAVVDPDELGLPIGSRVRVHGKMIMGGVKVRANDPWGDPTLKTVWRIPGEPPGEQWYIIPQSKPDVLKKGDR